MGVREDNPQEIIRAARERIEAILQNTVPARERSTKTVPISRHRQAMEHWEQVCPDRYRAADLASLERLLDDPEPFPRTLYDDVLGWLSEDPPQENVVIAGDIGVGKSWLASVLCRETAYRFGWWNEFVYADRLFDECKNANNERRGGLGVLDRYIRTNLLVIDDIGAGRKALTEFEESKLSLLINERWLARKLSVITTNLDLQAFRNFVGDRIADRISDPILKLVVPGKSRRNSRQESF